MQNGPLDEHEHEEGCLCGVEVRGDELTSDEDLPEAANAVDLAPDTDDDTVAADGCDLDFNEDLTTDEDLPVAIGGASL